MEVSVFVFVLVFVLVEVSVLALAGLPGLPPSRDRRLQGWRAPGRVGA